ncbi:MAG: hypothetical protein N2376_05675 [Clostridia bacterium]|nr:hypothetical protein [Clostridia bacterium]
MKIADSHVQMDSQWSATRQSFAKETVQFWNQEPNQSTNEGVLVDISEEGKTLQQKSIQKLELSEDDSPFELPDLEKDKLKMLEDFIYILSGKRIKFVVLDKLKQDLVGIRLKDLPRRELLPSNTQPVNLSQPSGVVRQGWGFKLDYQEGQIESEKMSFSSKGSVTTADGRQIQFNLDLKVSRELVQTQNLSVRAGDALLDPLIINFKNASASLGDRNYAFDIDCDGNQENIAFTGQGSGFLALDLNGNQTIDDGSELFGPQSGNGFGELSKYDKDNNGWIDENDEIYSKLRIWTLNEKGEKTLFSLGQAGVGAIYLGNASTELGLRGSSLDTTGQIRSTGIFLKESGQVGTIQHVDLAI